MIFRFVARTMAEKKIQGNLNLPPPDYKQLYQI